MLIFFKIVCLVFLAIALFGFLFTKKFLEIFCYTQIIFFKTCGLNVQFKIATTKIARIFCLIAIIFISFILYNIKTEYFNNNLSSENRNSNLIILKDGGAIEAKIKKEDSDKLYLQHNLPIINKKDIDTIIRINKKDFLDVIFNRNSCHFFFKYGPEIPDSHIQLMLRAAMSCPSGYDLRSWCFIVVKEKKLIEDLLLPIIDESGVERGRLNANVIFVVCAKEDSYKNNHTDPLLASVYLWLCAEYLNYAAAFVDIIMPDSQTRINLFKEKLSIPKNITPYYMILVGYYDSYKKPVNKFDISNIHYNSWTSTTN